MEEKFVKPVYRLENNLSLCVIYDKIADKYGSFMVFDNKVNAQRYYLQLFATVPNYNDYVLYTIADINPESALVSPFAFSDGTDSVPQYLDITPTEDAIALYRKQLDVLRRRTNG